MTPMRLDLWDFPTAKATLEDIASDLRKGVSQILLWAIPYEQEAFLEELERELSLGYGSEVRRVYLEDFRNHEITSSGIGEAVRLPGRSKIALDTPPEVVVLIGFEKRSLQDQRLIMEFYSKWRIIAHSHDIQDTLVLIIPAKSLTDEHLVYLQREKPEVKGRVRIIAGIPSAIEVQLAYRQEAVVALEPEAQWKELLISSIAGNDLELASFLWRCKLGSLTEVQSAIKDFINQYQTDGMSPWDTAVPASWKPIPRGIKPTLEKHLLNLKLMEQRITLYTPEMGEEIHPVITLMTNNEEDLKHRMWRFQASFLMPIIDQVRMKMINLLGDKLHTLGLNGREVEIRDICYYLESLSNEERDRQLYYEPLERIRNIRNRLAHLSPISLEECATLFNFWYKVQEQNAPGSARL